MVGSSSGTGIPGTAGGVVSIVTVTNVNSSPAFPTLSTACTFSVCSPSNRSDEGVNEVLVVWSVNSPSRVTMK